MGSKKLTLEYIKSKTKEIAEGYECISEEYISGKEKLLFRCNKNHVYEASWSNFSSNNRRCPHCTNERKGDSQRLNIEYVKSKTKEIAEGYECLSDNYKNSKTKLKFICPEQHIFYMSWGSFKSGCRCPQCGRKKTEDSIRLNIEYIKRKTYELTNGEYKCLSDSYKNNRTKLKFRCPKNHDFMMSWDNFCRGSRCPICANSRRGTKRGINIHYIKEYVQQFGYICLSDVYGTSYDHLKLKCTEDHIVYISWGNFRKGHRCRECSTKGRTKYDETTRTELYSYKEYINRLTNQNYIKYFYLINPEKLNRSFEEYHLDHIYSIIDGFNNGIDPEIISSPVNLRMLPMKENIVKHGTSLITKEELLKAYNDFKKNNI